MKASKTIYRNLAMIPDTSFDAEGQLLNNVCESLFREAMEQLNLKERHLVILRGWFGCSFYEISVAENISMNTARRRYARLVRDLKGMMMQRFTFQYHIYKEQLLWEPS